MSIIGQVKLHSLLTLIKDLIEPRFPESSKSEYSRKVKCKWTRWLIVTIELYQPCLPFLWREFVDKIKECDPILQVHGGIEGPLYSSI